jgi:hypothetical protein
VTNKSKNKKEKFNMKKSQIYNWAQCAVLESNNITTLSKIEMIRELISAEDLALYSEAQEEKKAGETDEAV